MIIEQARLDERLEPHGIGALYPNTGRYDFMQGSTVHRVGLLAAEDLTIKPSLRAECVLLEGTDAVAERAAEHLVGLGVNYYYLLPHVHWEHELADHHPAVWAGVLAGLGCRVDDPGLTAANAVVVPADRERLCEVIAGLLPGLDRADALLLTDAPLLTKLHHHQQVWFSSPDARWLPDTDDI